MEAISVHLAKIEELIGKIEDILEGAKPVPFSGKVAVDKHVVYDIIDDLRPYIDDINKDLPNEIIQAKRVISDSEKIINDARNKANMVLRNADAEIAKLTSEHEITKHANAQAEKIVEDGKKSARELRLNAIEYADEILAKAEDTVRTSLNIFAKSAREVEDTFGETIDLIYENRQELRGIKK